MTNADREFGNNNPYYDPDKCGLMIVASLQDEDACYSFDEIHLWKDLESGRFYAAHDSGCSCPTPFEEYRRLSDLTPIPDMAALRDLVNAHNSYVKWKPGPFYDTARTAGLP